MAPKPIAIALLFTVGAIAADVTSAPTFHKNVLPILQSHCQECHRPGEIGPFSMMSYQEVRPWAKSIRQAVVSKQMPPWHADDAHSAKMSNDRSLSKDEIEVLMAWADAGAPAGDPKDAPAPRQFPEGWTIGKPDVVLDLGTDFKVPAKGAVEYTLLPERALRSASHRRARSTSRIEPLVVSEGW